MRQWWSDVRTIMELCIKLLFARRWFVGVLCGLGVITFVLLSGLTESAEEKGRVEIALVVEEHTESAEQLSAFIKEQPLFLVWETERIEAMYALERGTIRAVLVIEQGYETWLMQQRKEKKLTLYYPEGQKDVQILSDLMAGGVLEQYCLYQSYAKYSGYKNLEPVSFTEYRQKAKEYQQSEDAGAVFEIQYETPGDTRNEEVGNESPEHTKGNNTNAVSIGKLAYLQVVLGMLAGIVLLLIFLLYACSIEHSVGSRSGIGQIGRGAVLLGISCYVFAMALPIGTILLAAFFWKCGLWNRLSLWEGGAIILKGMVYFIGFILYVGLIFGFLQGISRNAEFFLVFGTVLCLFGIGCGLFRVTGVFLPDAANTLLKTSPAGWFVDKITSLLYG